LPKTGSNVGVREKRKRKKKRKRRRPIGHAESAPKSTGASFALLV
jgi:hypothetical protein